jgi:predicted phage baseplate assembly protein
MTDARRSLVRQRRLFGIDSIEPDDAGRVLSVTFLGKAPHRIGTGNIRVDGGWRITGIRVVGVDLRLEDDPELDDAMIVRVDRTGDGSEYTLSVVTEGPDGAPGTVPFPGFDPRYHRASFRFQVGGATDDDCAVAPVGPPSGTGRPRPVIDYTARDYDSLLRMLLDRMSLTMPAWTERHAPDLGVTLVELLAYTGDQLSYSQDAVGTEAYLTTARRRVSVRRHVRLIDYAMHDGCNARAFVTIEVSKDVSLPRGGYRFAAIDIGGGPVITDEQLRTLPPGTACEVFEPLGHRAEDADLRLYRAHNTIGFWTWGDEDSRLARGATSATLRDTGRELRLRPGDLLLIEEMTDPAHRQVVRLTSVTAGEDKLFEQDIVEVTWAEQDALAFNCAIHDDASVAHGNVVLADHGFQTQTTGTVLSDWPVTQCAAYPSPRLVSGGQAVVLGGLADRVRDRVHELWRSVADGDELPAEAVAELETIVGGDALGRVGLADDAERALRELLARFDELLVVKLERLATLIARAAAGTVLGAALVWEIGHTWGRRYMAGLDPEDPVLAGPASTALAQDPRSALPAVRADGAAGTWRPARDLLAAGPRDRLFVGELGDDGRLALRFGDGIHGAVPPFDGELRVSYRVGNGTVGNVGPGAINHLVLRDGGQLPDVLAVRNPMAAVGGTDHEPVSEVRLLAPLASRTSRRRAVTADDYARLAARVRGVLRAAADIRWTGSGEEVHVAVEPAGPAFADERAGPEVPSDALIAEVTVALAAFRRIGHGLVVGAPDLVPLDIELQVLVDPDYRRRQVVDALHRVFGSGLRPDGDPAFFNPRVVGFGEPVRVSRLVAAAVGVPGVTSARVTRLKRLAGPDERALVAGLLRIGPLAVAVCDSSPDQPGNGRVSIVAGGGR